MKKMKNKRYFTFLKYIPLALCIILIILYLSNKDKITVQTIINYTPKNKLTAALVLLSLYALKSLSIVFPIIILEVASSQLFPTIIAFIINMLGIILGMVISYFVGYFSGSSAVEKITQKYPIIEKFIKKQSKSPFFTCFLLRTLTVFPREAVSIYSGAVRFPFSIYLLAGTLGSIPNTILATLFGANVTEPTSPAFWISILLMLIFAGGSFLVYNKLVKDK